ncbi:hypothetical protein EXIGLDRAFT_335113 [Exidia glandulosa HHB12029]|uniref:Uncharacterized protein n=1 Tax=Exidia glandulosa HHB12029 TaxID=1314781 RepID=A0A165CN34_EXIGL|nr:hypothetical protein EXIGLDRAFT_335113 [Exidia glandulosa HHB12029]
MHVFFTRTRRLHRIWAQPLAPTDPAQPQRSGLSCLLCSSNTSSSLALHHSLLGKSFRCLSPQLSTSHGPFMHLLTVIVCMFPLSTIYYLCLSSLTHTFLGFLTSPLRFTLYAFLRILLSSSD